MVGEDYQLSSLLARANSNLWIAVSNDGGATFTTRSIVATTTDDVSFALPSVAADPRANEPNVFVSWTTADSNGQQIWVAVSDDGGQTFSEIGPISDQFQIDDPLISNDWTVSTSTVHVGIDGTYYVVWFQPDDNYNQGPDDHFVMRRRLAGSAVYDPPVASAPRVIAELVGLSNPQNSLFNNNFAFGDAMAVNSADGFDFFRDTASITSGRWPCTKEDVYVVFAADDADFLNSYANANIYMVVSNDGGENWGAPVRAQDGDDTEPPGHFAITFGSPSEYFPNITTSDSGHIGLSFITSRNDVAFTDSTPDIANQDYVPYFAYSADMGDTFVTEFAVEDFGAPGFRISLPRQADDHNELYWIERSLFSERAALTMYGRTFRPTWMTLRNWVLPQDAPLTWERTRHGNSQSVGDILSAAIEMQVHVRPDFDFDCDVDLGDFGIFSLCFGGTGNPPAPECPPGIDADLDGDGDVDQGDFAEFSLCFGGSKNGCAGAGGCGAGESAAPTGQPTPGAPESPMNDIVLPDNPKILEMYLDLEEYCRVNGIPFS